MEVRALGADSDREGGCRLETVVNASRVGGQGHASHLFRQRRASKMDVWRTVCVYLSVLCTFLFQKWTSQLSALSSHKCGKRTGGLDPPTRERREGMGMADSGLIGFGGRLCCFTGQQRTEAVLP